MDDVVDGVAHGDRRAGEGSIFGDQFIADAPHPPPLQFEHVRPAGGGRHGVRDEGDAARSLGG